MGKVSFLVCPGLVVILSLLPFARNARSETELLPFLVSPTGIAVESSGTSLLVVDSNAGRLSRVNVVSGEVTTITEGLIDPIRVALNSSGTSALILERPDPEPSRLVQVDLLTGDAFLIASGFVQAADLTVQPNAAVVFIVDQSNGGTLLRVDLLTQSVSSIASGFAFSPLHSVALEPGGSSALVAAGRRTFGSLPTGIFRVNLASGEISLVTGGPGIPREIIVESGGDTALVMTQIFGGNAGVARVDLATGQATRIFGTGFLPIGSASLRDMDLEPGASSILLIGSRAFGHLSLFRLELSTGIPEMVVPYLGGPTGIASGPDSNSVLVSVGALLTGGIYKGNPVNGVLQRLTGSGQSVVIEPSGDAALFLNQGIDDASLLRMDFQTGNVAVIADNLRGPKGLDVNFQDNFALVTETGIDALTKIDLPTGTTSIITTDLVNPAGVALEPGNQSALVAEASSPPGRISRVDLVSSEVTAVVSDLGIPTAIAIEAGGTSALVAIGHTFEPDACSRVIRIGLASGELLDVLAEFARCVNPGFQMAIDASGATVLLPSGRGVFRIDIGPPVGPPTNLRATPGNQMVDLRWDGDFEDVRGWNVYFRMRSSDELPWSRIPNPSNPDDETIPTTRFTHYRVNRDPYDFHNKLLANGITYEFSTTTVHISGAESQISDLVAAVPRFGNPQNKKPVFPILFLPGIASSAETWRETKEFLKETYGWTFGGELEIVPYGLLNDVPDNLRVCTLEDPCARFNSLGINADFYTATFFDDNAGYDNGLGIIQQGRETKAFLKELRNLYPIDQKFIIVAHSMGGLAARSYMAALATDYNNEIAHLITYGTPHAGTPLATFLQNSELAAFFVQLGFNIDADGAAVRDLEPTSPFLTHLINSAPPIAHYTSIISFGPIQSPQCYLAAFDVLIFSILGPSDCIVSVLSQDIRTVEPDLVDGESRANLLLANRRHFREETRDHASILKALNQTLTIIARSPVDLEVTDPAGFRLSKTLNEIPGASYEELVSEHQLKTHDAILIPFPLPGAYSIGVIPEAEATPEDTYSLQVTRVGETTFLTRDEAIKDIPSEPFTFAVAAIDVRPGSVGNPINLRSKGVIPVAILGTDSFESASVEPLSVRFGPGDAFEVHGKGHIDDVNNDGKADLILHFRTQNSEILPGDTVVCLTGNKFDRTPIVGCDTIRVR